MSHRPSNTSILREYQRAHRPSLFRRMFRERNLYLRSDFGVRFISIKPWMQVTAIVVFVLFSFWASYATMSAIFKDRMLAEKDHDIISEQQRRKSDLARARADYAAREAALRAKIRELKSKLMLDQDAWLARVEEVRRDYEKLLKRQELLKKYLDKTGLLRMPDGEGANADEHGGGRGDRLTGNFITRFSKPFHAAAEAEKPLALLRAMHDRAAKRQLRLLDMAAEKAGAKLASIRRIYKKLGLDPVRMAARAEPDAAGGPFIPLIAKDADGKAVIRRMDRIGALLGEFSTLKKQAARLPMALPMKNFRRISSRFGYRSDPFRHRLALHAGVDFKAAYGAPILATAPGVVTRAGWTGSYGKLVEIRHDNGLVTRYAHQSRVLVHVGQRVRRGQRIGRLGNTGRSTGPHLHYETRLHGAPVNPERFWKARNDISQIKIGR